MVSPGDEREEFAERGEAAYAALPAAGEIIARRRQAAMPPHDIAEVQPKIRRMATTQKK